MLLDNPFQIASAGVWSARPNEKLSTQGASPARQMAFSRSVAATASLPARQKHDARHGRGHGATQTAHGRLGHDRHVGLLWTVRARHDHARLEEHLFEGDAMLAQGDEHAFQRGGRDLFAACDGVAAVHQDFRFDNRRQPGFLAQRGEERQRPGVHLDARARGKVLPNRNHRAPLGETCAQLAILDEPVAQAIKPFGDLFAGEGREGRRVLVHLDARNDALLARALPPWACRPSSAGVSFRRTESLH